MPRRFLRIEFVRIGAYRRPYNAAPFLRMKFGGQERAENSNKKENFYDITGNHHRIR